MNCVWTLSVLKTESFHLSWQGNIDWKLYLKKKKKKKMHHLNTELNVFLSGSREHSECSFKTESTYEIYTQNVMHRLVKQKEYYNSRSGAVPFLLSLILWFALTRLLPLVNLFVFDMKLTED